MTLTDTSSDALLDLGAGACAGYGGYSDMGTGAGVVVSDGTGKVIGNSQLDQGQRTGEGCQFRFLVTSVPKADFYKIEVAHRGTVTYSYGQLQQQAWSVELTLGH